MSDENLLERYFANSLNKEEMAAFEARMQNDQQFANEVNALKEIDLTLEGLGADQLANDLKSWSEELDASPKTRTISMRKTFSIAAAVGLLIVAMIFMFQNNASNQELFTEYFTDYPDLLTAREHTKQAELSAGMKAYREGKYEQAILHLTNLIQGVDSPNSAKLYLAIALIRNQDAEKASQYLRQLVSDEQLGQQAEWYLSLLHLFNDDSAEAIAALRTIAQNDAHYQREKAQEILRQLDR